MVDGPGGAEVGRISIRVVPNTSKFRQDLKADLERIERDAKVKVKVEPEVGRFREKVAAATRDLKDAKVKVDVDVDNGQLALFDLEVKRDRKVDVDVDVHSGQLKALDAELHRPRHVRIKAEVDHDLFSRSMSRITSEISRVSSQIDSVITKVATGFGSSFEKFTPNIGGFGGVASIGIILGAASLLAPALALFSSALVSLPALLGAGGIAIGTFALGLDGLKKALDDSGILKDTPGKKGGKGKQGLGEALQELKTNVSGVFEKGFTPIFTQLAGVIPTVADGLPKVAQGFVDMAQGVTNALTTPQALTGFKDIITNTATALTTAAPGLQSFTTGLVGLADKVSAHLPGLSSFFDEMGTKFAGWVDKISKNGQLDSAVSGLKPILESVMNFVGKLTDAGLQLAANPDMSANITKVVDGLTNFITNVLPQLNTIFGSLASIFGDIKPPPGPARPDHPAAPKGVQYANAPGAVDEVRPGEAPLRPPAPGRKVTGSDILRDLVSGLFPSPGDKSHNALSDIGQWFSNTFTRPHTDHPVIKEGTAGGDKPQAPAVDTKPDDQRKAFDELAKAADKAVKDVGATLGTLPAVVVAALSGLRGAGQEAGAALCTGLVTGIASGTGAVADAARNVANAAINSAHQTLGIHSPSTVFRSIGQNIMQGLLGGMKADHDAVVDQAQKTAQAVTGAANKGATYTTSVGGIRLVDNGTSTAGSDPLTNSLLKAGIDPRMVPLLHGFAKTEGQNPSGAWTLGFTDSQAGTSLDEHAKALAQQIKDRQSVAGKFPASGSKQDQAAWIATVVGQQGVSSDWQGNAQPGRDDYIGRVVSGWGPGVSTAPAHNTSSALGDWNKFADKAKEKGLIPGKVTPLGSGAALGNWDKFAAIAQGKGLLGQALVGSTPSVPTGGSSAPSYTPSPLASGSGRSPAAVGLGVGKGLTDGIQQGLDTGAPGVIKSAQTISQQLQDAINGGGPVSPDLARNTESTLSDLTNERKQLDEQSKNLPKGDPQRKDIESRRQELSGLEKNIRDQEKQLGGAKAFNKDIKNANQSIDPSQFINKSISAGTNFAMANINQFEQDIGWSGNGAIPQLAQQGLSWLTGAVSKMVSGAFSGAMGGKGSPLGGGTSIHVNSVDEALAAHQTIQNRAAMQYTGR